MITVEKQKLERATVELEGHNQELKERETSFKQREEERTRQLDAREQEMKEREGSLNQREQQLRGMNSILLKHNT